ncbi:MAM and LDL-receptor class A domain-containing protein 2 [Trichonephila clavata]|uniref:MAM and LDL-receptor class A domain-containing protein 2 n=1 Tax=Trichonephila clavata TaxID=2740835 RepID=A0A8X6HCS4_TRICU|nr:MAM and LDL-receptor class A domain-containing protein 2 [Trichonephila clavata]
MTRVKPEEVTLQTIVLEGNYCLRFFYYMYGADTDDLKVAVHSIYNSSAITEYFSHRKTQGDRWKEALISISPTSTMRLRGYRVTFTALQKTAYRLGGAVALDDIELTLGLCPSRKENAMELCTFDAHNCGYTTNGKSSEKWEHKSSLKSSLHISAVPEKDHTLGTSYGGFWFSIKEDDMDTQASFLRSPIYKAPKTSMNCLQFFYIVEESGSWFNWIRSTKEIYVRAIINYPNSKTKNQSDLMSYH